MSLKAVIASRYSSMGDRSLLFYYPRAL